MDLHVWIDYDRLILASHQYGFVLHPIFCRLYNPFAAICLYLKLRYSQSEQIIIIVSPITWIFVGGQHQLLLMLMMMTMMTMITMIMNIMNIIAAIATICSPVSRAAFPIMLIKPLGKEYASPTRFLPAKSYVSRVSKNDLPLGVP